MARSPRCRCAAFHTKQTGNSDRRGRVCRPLRIPRDGPVRKDIWLGTGAVASVARMGEAVLVVEHEGPTRAFLSQQLSDDGFEVFAADRATSALELVEAGATRSRPAGRDPARRLRVRAVWPAPCGRARARVEPRRPGDHGQHARRPPSTGSAASPAVRTTTSCGRSSTRSSSRACERSCAGPAANHRCLAVRELDIDLASRVVRVAGEAGESRRRSSTFWSRSPRIRSASSARRGSSGTSGGSGRSAAPGRWTPMRAACAASYRPRGRGGLERPQRLGRWATGWSARRETGHVSARRIYSRCPVSWV